MAKSHYVPRVLHFSALHYFVWKSREATLYVMHLESCVELYGRNCLDRKTATFARSGSPKTIIVVPPAVPFSEIASSHILCGRGLGLLNNVSGKCNVLGLA